MGFVTGKTVLTHGRMFPYEGSALVLMTTEAGFADPAIDKHALTGRTMRIVTRGTAQIAFRNGMTGSSLHLCRYIGVTGRTNVLFIRRLKQGTWTLRLHNRVA